MQGTTHSPQNIKLVLGENPKIIETKQAHPYHHEQKYHETVTNNLRHKNLSIDSNLQP